MENQKIQEKLRNNLKNWVKFSVKKGLPTSLLREWEVAANNLTEAHCHFVLFNQMQWEIVLCAFIGFLLNIEAFKAAHHEKYRLPIVYVYTVVPRVCSQGLPNYIKMSLEQAIFSQPDCDVLLARLLILS